MSEADTGEPRYRDEEWLREQYWEEEKSTLEIADKCNAGSSTISRWMKKHEIPSRELGRNTSESPDSYDHRNKEWLRKQYWGEGKSTTEIAEVCDVSQAAVWYWMEKHGVERAPGGSATHSANYHDREWLREQYWERECTQQEIADKCGVGLSTISRWMNKHGVPTRKTNDTDMFRSDTFNYRDKEWLREQYRGEGKTAGEIGDMCGVVRSTIARWMREHGIERRPMATDVSRASRPNGADKLENENWLQEQYHTKGRSTVDIAGELGVSPNTISNWIESHGIEKKSLSDALQTPPEYKYQDEDWLRSKYRGEELRASEIAEGFDCTPSTIRRWMQKHGIESRPRPSGPDSACWKGGKPTYGEGWTQTKRRRVREAAGYKCEACGMSQGAHRDQHGQRLHVHHIIPARKFDSAEKRNDESNLTALCRPCHSKWEGIPLQPTRPD